MPRPLIAALVYMGLAVLQPISAAQMRAPAMSMPGSVAFTGLGRNIGVSFGRPRSAAFGGAIFLGDPFYANPVEPLPVSTPPPQIVIVQSPVAADSHPETKSEPLLIELQGTRYVRFGGSQQPSGRGTNAALDYAEADAGSVARRTQPELPPTLLIFRDGHREQIPEYVTVGGTLYANGDYWQSGQWTKNIQLSNLNIPATVQANHDNGVKFMLPSGPNEVVTRP